MLGFWTDCHYYAGRHVTITGDDCGRDDDYLRRLMMMMMLMIMIV